MHFLLAPIFILFLDNIKIVMVVLNFLQVIIIMVEAKVMFVDDHTFHQLWKFCFFFLSGHLFTAKCQWIPNFKRLLGEISVWIVVDHVPIVWEIKLFSTVKFICRNNFVAHVCWAFNQMYEFVWGEIKMVVPDQIFKFMCEI